MKFKKLICVCLTVCMVGAFGGCTSNDGVSPSGNQNSSNTDVKDELSFINMLTGDAGLEEYHDNNVITSVRWQKLRLSEEHIKAYPALSDAFEKHNKECLTGAKAQMYEFEPLIEDMEGDEFNPAVCQTESKIYMQRADIRIVSLLEYTEKYTGGIHPDFFVSCINLNPHTGDALRLSDVLTDTKDLPDLLAQKITQKYEDVAFYDLEDTLGKYKPEEFTWTMDYQGITFWFSPYEIASYAVGTLSAKIWFDELPDIFAKGFSESPENYVMCVPVQIDAEFDLTADDGKTDIICVQKQADDYGSYNMLSVEVNGKSGIDEDNYAYDFDVYLAHLGGKNYIYSDSTSDNDYHIICVWDINGNTPQITQELHGTEFDYEYIEEGFEEGTVYTQAVNNPDTLKLEKRFEILGTRGATARYRMNPSDGSLQMTDDVYTFNYGHDVVTSTALEAEILPDMQKTQIESGTSLSPYQTDGETFVDLKKSNGQIIRLEYNASEYPHTIDGVDEEECFEELMYAG